MLPLTLLPFLTNLRAAYPEEYITTLLYAGGNIACGAVLFAVWSYGKRQGLLSRAAPSVDRSMRRRILLGIAINILGAAVALINPYLSSPVFLLLPCIWLPHRTVDSHWASEEDDTATESR